MYFIMHYLYQIKILKACIHSKQMQNQLFSLKSPQQSEMAIGWN